MQHTHRASVSGQRMLPCRNLDLSPTDHACTAHGPRAAMPNPPTLCASLSCRRVTLALGPSPSASFVPAFSETMLAARVVPPSEPRTTQGIYW